LRELESLGAPPNLPDDLARRLEVCKDHIRRRRRKIRELKRLREQVRGEIEKLEVNERWLRQGPQLAALAEQADWAAAEAKRVGDLRRRVQLDQRIAHMEHTLGEQDQGQGREKGQDQENDLPSSEPLLSVGSMVGLGALFVLGGPLIFAWAVLSGPLSWFLG